MSEMISKRKIWINSFYRERKRKNKNKQLFPASAETCFETTETSYQSWV